MAVDTSLDFTFLDAVNRILRINTLIRGDDDNVTTFSDTQHAANIQLAMISVQDELIELSAGPEHLLDLEFATGTLTTSNGQRIYSLASNFIRFSEKALFYDASRNYHLPEFPGGRRRLKQAIPNYQSQSGNPNWWYWEPSTNKSVAFYLVPDGTYTLTYDYERSVMVDLATDELPFQTSEEAYTFCTLAARRFKFMFERAENLQVSLPADAIYRHAYSRLRSLLRPTNPPKGYGRVYI